MTVDVSSITQTDHVYKFVLANGVKVQGNYKSKDANQINLYNDVMKQNVTVYIRDIASFQDDGGRYYSDPIPDPKDTDL